jgi:type I restriction enzyme S subunit
MNMQVRLGYKLTEVGVIPEDWKVLPLRDALTHGRLGGNYSNSEVEQSKPLMKMGNIARGYFQLEKIEYIPDRQNAEPEHKLRLGDLLFNTRNTLDLVGKVAIWRAELPVAYYNSNLMRLEFDSKKISSNMFANYILNANSSISRLRAIATGTTSVAAIYTRDLMQFTIPVPPHAEQQAIGEALSDIDTLISGLNQLIAKKRDIKQAATQQLLTGQQRLPGFSGEWVVKPIGESIDLLTGFPFSSDSYSDSGVKLLRGSNVKRGKTDWSDEITQFWPSINQEIAKYEIKVGDLVISMDGSLVGRSYARIVEGDLPALLLQRVARIRSRTIDIGYLAQFIGSSLFISYCDSVKTVTAIPHISADDIRSFSIPTPPTIAEQTAIANILSDMDSELTALEARCDKARQLKQGMMQELLTGKIRIS